MQRVILIGNYGDDKTICDAARMSFNTGKEYTEEQNEKLIKRMIESGHTSPFEQVNFTFKIHAPIFIARQWMRHRTGKYNEVSGRYTELKREFFKPSLFRAQNGTEFNNLDLLQELENFYNKSYDFYEHLITEGVCREQARAVLPLGIYTEFIFQMDLHNLMHFLRLRLHKGAQAEIREYAKDILRLIQPIVPITIKYFVESLGNENNF